MVELFTKSGLTLGEFPLVVLANSRLPGREISPPKRPPAPTTSDALREANVLPVESSRKRKSKLETVFTLATAKVDVGPKERALAVSERRRSACSLPSTSHRKSPDEKPLFGATETRPSNEWPTWIFAWAAGARPRAVNEVIVAAAVLFPSVNGVLDFCASGQAAKKEWVKFYAILI